MKSNDSIPVPISVPDLPSEIYVSYQLHPPMNNGGDIAALQNRSGSDLTRSMIRTFLNHKHIELTMRRNEKPHALADQKEISVSFSHTDKAVVSAISQSYRVGCDMEYKNREVHPKLLQRLSHPDEDKSLYDRMKPIRLWTLKESALKMIGTGLRKPMKSVAIEGVTDSLYHVLIDDGIRAKICSFEYKRHWISICYQ